ncbi:MAG: glutamine--fructose-6-phosphate transaminase (isomerizing) [Oscillospiraceae bacterium]|jgi:glucosamine--fructose-6-phosphate aminotransferase (isomerizing)|nr:glutamine--fructose-6-phosphate transaminase (isomerizing) [Oscillospiraceae bacterium]
MCGIIGYIGNEEATELLLNGLEKLEYRGYDSAGLAVFDGRNLKVAKSKGRLKVLREVLKNNGGLKGKAGIGHTRWATHGKPSDENSHPHVSTLRKFAVVHNGIIENYLSIKNFLISKGKKFSSETDTEVIAQLLEYYDNGNTLDTVVKVLNDIKGSYAIGIIYEDNPEEIIAAKKDNPLIIGIGENENFITSDVTAIVSKTKNIVRLKDSEIAVIKSDDVIIYDMNKNFVKKEIKVIDWNIDSAEKCGYDHFMLKEIMEQPKAVKDTICSKIKENEIFFDKFLFSKEYLEKINKIFIIACGSAYHVGYVGKYLFEKLFKKPVEVDIASEFRYRDPIVDKNSLVILISQSGETADTLAALRKSKQLGARTLSIVNVIGSSIATESDDVFHTRAGPEIAVATTKAYSAQLCAIYLLAIYFSRKLNTISLKKYNYFIKELIYLPEKISKVFNITEQIRNFSKNFYQAKNVFFIGRNLDYVVSLEGSLKLKEISYIHAEAYAAGELKHGTISLIENNTLIVATLTQKSLVGKTVSNIKEVKARGAIVLLVVTKEVLLKDEHNLKNICDFVFILPDICDEMSPSVSVVPLQLLSYYIALMRGCDIDKPRNLAKSVTVE